MPAEKNQVKFRCSDRFLQRIKSECIKRETTVQDLVTAALKIYFRTPNEWNTADVAFLTFDEDAKSEQHDWVSLWAKYFSKMPREKVLLIVEVMKLDLLHYRSSRRKADLRRRQQAGKEGTHVEARTE